MRKILLNIYNIRKYTKYAEYNIFYNILILFSIFISY